MRDVERDETTRGARGQRRQVFYYRIETGKLRPAGFAEWGLFRLGEEHSSAEEPEQGGHIAIVEWEYGDLGGAGEQETLNCAEKAPASEGGRYMKRCTHLLASSVFASVTLEISQA